MILFPDVDGCSILLYCYAFVYMYMASVTRQSRLGMASKLCCDNQRSRFLKYKIIIIKYQNFIITLADGIIKVHMNKEMEDKPSNQWVSNFNVISSARTTLSVKTDATIETNPHFSELTKSKGVVGHNLTCFATWKK